MVRHGLSFDIECYYQIVAKDYLRERLAPTSEVVRNTSFILDCLGEAGVKATFFTLGNVARAFPQLIRRIVEEGHELAVHGDEHLYLTDLDPAAFREELARAIGALEDAGGVRITGHRAPAFSLVERTMWAADVLQEAGLGYDSSIYPFAGRRYGIAGTPRAGHRLANGLVELPMTVVDWRGRVLPAAGGGYVRYFPYRFSRWAISQVAAAGRPAVAYFHPYEFEPSRPQLPATAAPVAVPDRLRLAKFNALQGIGRGEAMRRKLRRLIGDFAFGPLRDIAAAVPESSELPET